MDVKERKAFQECYKTSRDYKFYVRHEMSEKQIFEFKKGKYVVDCVNDGWEIWQAAKAQVVPEGFVVVTKEPTRKMIDVGMDNFCFPLDNGRFYSHDLVLAYRAMIEAAQG